jgi:hypothetical protein
MDKDRVRDVAADAGLGRLDGKQMAQLANGIASARDLARQLPKDLHWGEEIALVFRLPTPAGRKP